MGLGGVFALGSWVALLEGTYEAKRWIYGGDRLPLAHNTSCFQMCRAWWSIVEGKAIRRSKNDKGSWSIEYVHGPIHCRDYHTPLHVILHLCPRPRSPQNKEQYGRELAWLNPKVATAENRAVEIERLVDQMNLQLSLLSSSHKKASEDVADLKVKRALDWQPDGGWADSLPARKPFDGR